MEVLFALCSGNHDEKGHSESGEQHLVYDENWIHGTYEKIGNVCSLTILNHVL